MCVCGIKQNEQKQDEGWEGEEGLGAGQRPENSRGDPTPKPVTEETPFTIPVILTSTHNSLVTHTPH